MIDKKSYLKYRKYYANKDLQYRNRISNTFISNACNSFKKDQFFLFMVPTHIFSNPYWELVRAFLNMAIVGLQQMFMPIFKFSLIDESMYVQCTVHILNI